jgi:hypothetical protein
MLIRRYVPRLRNWPRDRYGRLLPKGEPDQLGPAKYVMPLCLRQQHEKCRRLLRRRGVAKFCNCQCHGDPTVVIKSLERVPDKSYREILTGGATPGGSM